MKILLLLLIASVAISNSETKIKVSLQGIWIPKKIIWEKPGNDAGFRTLYFYNDSCFTMIASLQRKIKDSIYFEAEPGYRVHDCKIKKEAGKTFVVAERLYSFLKIPNDKLFDTLSIDTTKTNKVFLDNICYVRATKYTKESIESIISTHKSNLRN